MVDKGKIKLLLNKYVEGQCSGEEKAWIETWYNRQQTGGTEGLPDNLLEEDLQKIYRALPGHPKKAP